MHSRPRSAPVWLAAFAVAALTACAASAGPESEPTAPPIDQPSEGAEGEVEMVRVIVKVRATSDPEGRDAAIREVEALARELGATRTSPMKGVPLIVIELPEDKLETLREAPAVERVQRDTPDKPY